MRNKTLKVLTTALLILSLFFLFSCKEEENLSIIGNWSLTTNNGFYSAERWIITETSIQYLSSWTEGTEPSIIYKADIIEYVDGSFNEGDTTISSNTTVSGQNPGYAVICYTYSNSDSTATVGDYNIFRWQDNETDSSLKDFTQGYKAVDADNFDYTNDLFDSADSAVSGATNAAGYFSAASCGASE